MADILSVGIDIGTSTTQLVFSRLKMENTTGYFSVPRVSIVAKELVYRSEIYLTPLRTATLIDADGVRKIAEMEYRKAGYRPTDVDTGAVIITGESARKENAALVIEKMSDFAGEFVVSTAGPDLESVIAGKGSGAFSYSKDNDCTVVNLDIGGGTTNIVLFDGGETRGLCCFDIGGRLIRFEEDGRVSRIAPSAEKIIRAVGAQIAVGRKAERQELRKVTDKMASLLAQALYLEPQEPLLETVRTKESSVMQRPERPIRRICMSGGVADCMENEEPDDWRYGDIGILLGRSLREGKLLREIQRIKGTETIRATVVGAGSYTTNVSGSTISYADELLPMKNVPALRLDKAEEDACYRGDSNGLETKIRWFLEQTDTERFILAMEGRRDPQYGELKRLAESIAGAYEQIPGKERPILVALRQDTAKALGGLLQAQFGGKRPVLCIDGVEVEEGNYMDLGHPVMGGLVIPVVVKTLLFG